jgi:hypothetical protein
MLMKALDAREHIKVARDGLGEWCCRGQQSHAGPGLVLAAAYLVAGGRACGVLAGRARAGPECEVGRVLPVHQDAQPAGGAPHPGRLQLCSPGRQVSCIRRSPGSD